MKILFVLWILAATVVYAEEQRVALPEGYKADFVEYLSLDRVQNHDQFIRLFANDVAMKGKNPKGELPNGSILVAEVYSVAKNADGSVKYSMLNRRIKDKLKLIAVMEKQTAFGLNPASKVRTGNWDFAAFKPNGDIAPKDLDACRGCHLPLDKTDYVFSIEHISASN